MAESGWFKRISDSAANRLTSLNLSSATESQDAPQSASPDSSADDIMNKDPASTSRSSKWILPPSRPRPSHPKQQQRSAFGSGTMGGPQPLRQSQDAPTPQHSPYSARTPESSASNTTYSSQQYRAPEQAQHFHQSAQPRRQSQQSGHHSRSNLFGFRTTQQTPQQNMSLSPDSTAGWPNSLVYAADFMVGAGMVILQPSTGCVVIVYDKQTKAWFLPKGRKDVGESLEQAALREAYEESGYRAEFLPLHTPTNAPTPLELWDTKPTRNTEPIYLSTYRWRNRRGYQVKESNGGEYLTFWYVGQIPHDAVREENTGMPDEKGYVSYIMERSVALRCLSGIERAVVEKAFHLWRADAQLEAWVTRDWESRQKRAEKKEQERIERAKEAPGESSTVNNGHRDSLR